MGSGVCGASHGHLPFTVNMTLFSFVRGWQSPTLPGVLSLYSMSPVGPLGPKGGGQLLPIVKSSSVSELLDGVGVVELRS